MFHSKDRINLSQKVQVRDGKIVSATPNLQVLHSHSPTDTYFSHRNRQNTSALQYHQLSAHFPGYTFSKIARFESNIFEKFKNLSPLFRSTSGKSKDLDSNRVSKNKNMKTHSPVEKILRIKTMSMQDDTHREKIRLKRDQIFKSIQKVRQDNLIQKFRKFEIRYNKTVKPIQESVDIKKSWVSLLALVGSAYMFTKVVARRRYIKMMAKIYVKWLASFVKCLVKMKIIAKRTKVKLAYRKIRRNIGIIQSWLVRVRKRNCKILTDSVDQMLLIQTTDFVFKVVRFKILRIQRLFRKAVLERKALINSLLNQWDYAEHFMGYEKIRSKRKRRKAMMSNNSVPLDIKIFLIKQKVNEYVQNYIIQMKNYQVIKRMKKNQINQISPLLASTLSKPVKPDISLLFTPPVFEFLIKLGQKEKKKRRESSLMHNL